MLKLAALRRFAWSKRQSMVFIYAVVLIVTVLITFYSAKKRYRTEGFSAKAAAAYYKNNANNLEKFKSRLSNYDFKAFSGEPVSPIDLIPRQNELVAKEYYQKNFASRFYSNIVGKAPKKFNEFDLRTKCHLYFRNLYAMNENWTNNLDQLHFNINDINNKTVEELKKQIGDDVDNESGIINYRKKNNVALAFERIRIYDECFLNPNTFLEIGDVFNEEAETSQYIVPPIVPPTATDKESLEKRKEDPYYNYLKYDQYDLEHRLFPMLKTFNKSTFHSMLPLITNGKEKGKYLEPGVVPVFGNNNKLKKFTKYEYNPKLTFWANWNAMSSLVAQKGIVLSVNEDHLDSFLRLLATLRFQKNKLPIQIINLDNELSEESMQKIYKTATSPFINLPIVDPYTGKSKPMEQPEVQQVWFVNVQNILDPEQGKKFTKFRIKWLASMFNLFEEFVFLDADVITYKPPSYFFEMPEYKESGTLFFRDRSLNEQNKNKCLAMIKSVFPKMTETINFDRYPIIDDDHAQEECFKYLNKEEKIYKQYFFDNRLQQMESGVVVINKAANIMALTLSSMMHLTGKLDSCSYGDKEFFWLGFLALGKPYKFNSVNAGVIGKLETEKQDLKTLEQRICTCQIAHFDENEQLLWINGGASNCKIKASAKKDWENPKYKFLKKEHASLSDLKKFYYKTPINVDYGIIPGDHIGSWNKKNSQCSDYYHCARYESRLTPFSFDDRIVKGKVFKIDDKQSRHINDINSLWIKFDHSKI